MSQASRSFGSVRARQTFFGASGRSYSTMMDCLLLAAWFSLIFHLLQQFSEARHAFLPEGLVVAEPMDQWLHARGVGTVVDVSSHLALGNEADHPQRGEVLRDGRLRNIEPAG